jgi:GAF domain-containing protein
MIGTHMARRLGETTTFETAIRTILDDAIALVGAEYGNVQLIKGDDLVIVEQRGLKLEFLRTFWRVNRDDGSACGRALRLAEIVVIADVETDTEFRTFRGDAKKAGFRAVQSTPLIASNGQLIGIVSTHFANVHAPTPIERETLKVYGIAAADHLVKLLAGAPLDAMAQRLNDELYESMLA